MYLKGSDNKLLNSIKSYLIPIILLFVSVIVIGNITTLPNDTIWDETYYIPAVQKYIDGTFFMESHPPLGKMLMAVGEIIVNPNDEYSKLNPLAQLCLSNTIIDNNGSKISLLEYRQQNPAKIDKSIYNGSNNINDTNKLNKGYSFCGVRFVPTLFAIFIPLLLYLIVMLISKNQYLSIFIALLALFDNALLTHYRAAMIDGIQMVMILLAIYFFIKVFQSNISKFNLNWFLMLFFVACSIAVKHNAIILLILPILSIINENKWRLYFKLFLSYAVIALIYTFIFMVHIDNGRVLVANSQDNQGFYNADNTTKEYLTKSSNDFNHFKILKSNLEYMNNYHLKVPLLDKSNPNENGSYPYMWPIMKKTIQYNSFENKKLLLFGNPIVWLISLISVLLALINLFKIFIDNRIVYNIYYKYLIVFTLLYSSYFGLMYVTSNLRVMYLYHYLVGLVLSFILLAIVTKLNNWDKKENAFYYGLALIVILISFWLVSPYTYYLPTNNNSIINKIIY